MEEVKFRLTSEDNASKTNEKVKGSFNDLQKSIGTAGIGFAAVGAGLGAFVVKAVEGAGKAEQLQTSFKIMIGDADLAKSTLASLTQFAATTPFELPEVQEAAKKLLAFGTEAKNLEPTLRSLGDVSAGVGAPIAEIAELYGKAKVQGRLFSQDINQLTGRGIPIIGELAKQFGVSENKVKDLVEKGKVGFPELEKAFASMSGEGGKFAGLMEAQSNTFLGQVSNISDGIGQLTVSFGEALLPTVKELGKYIGELIAWLGQLSPENKELIGQAIAVGAAFASIVGGIFLFIAAINPVTIAVAAVIAGFVLWKTKGDEIMAFLQSMGINVPAIWEGIVAGIGGAIQSITAFFGNMVTTIQQYWPTLVEGFNQVMAVVMPIWESFWNGISSITDSVIKIITAVVSMGWKIITNLFNEFIGYVAPIWSSFWAGLQPIITTAWAVILDIVTNGWNFVVDLFKTVAALFTGDWDAFWQNLGALAQSAWNLLGALIGGALKTIGSLFVGAWTFIADVWGKLWTALGVLWNTFATTTNQAITETWEGIKKGFQDLSNTATATWNGFWDGLGAKTNEVVAWIKKQIENLAGAISGLMSGLGKLATALPGGAIFGAFAGPKATGGRVMGGKSYLVGEEGPELFTPPGSGKITPNNKMGGGGGGTVINFYGTVSSKEVAIEYAGEVVRQLQFSSAII